MNIGKSMCTKKDRLWLRVACTLLLYFSPVYLLVIYPHIRAVVALGRLQHYHSNLGVALLILLSSLGIAAIYIFTASLSPYFTSSYLMMAIFENCVLIVLPFLMNGGYFYNLIHIDMEPGMFIWIGFSSLMVCVVGFIRVRGTIPCGNKKCKKQNQ